MIGDDGDEEYDSMQKWMIRDLEMQEVMGNWNVAVMEVVVD